jgi:hypothetical protein
MKRSIYEVTIEELGSGNADVQELVAERIPRAFPREISWPLWATALLARSAAILDSVTALAERGRRTDAEVALRTLYVQLATLCWLAIDPESHIKAWQRGSEAMWSKFQSEAHDFYGIEVLDREDAAGLATDKLKPLDQLADDVDAYWPEHIAAFRQRPGNRKELLSFRARRVIRG